MKAVRIGSLLLLALVVASLGCSDGLDGFVADDNLIQHEWPIINGSRTPNGSPYEAVVSIHDKSRRGISINPFCSGTLIATDVILTAAHCMSGTNPSKAAVYLGESPVEDYYAGTLTWDDFYMVSDISVHPDYNSRFIVNDIALMRLSAAVPSSVADPVPALPMSEGFTPADEGRLALDFAGFGQDENGDYGVKLHVNGTLDHLQGDHQIYYYQAWKDGGPCSGDSGGPAFVTRSGGVYAGGITSYGDAYCQTYGVSTRTDYFEQFISDFTGVAPDPGPDPDPACGDGVCSDGETCDSCPADCEISHPKKGLIACCGDGVCHNRESASQCPADCQ